MDAVCRKSLRSVGLMLVSVSLLFACGCGAKAPAEANAALKGALDALVKDDAKAFVAAVLPAQRETLSSVPEMEFFGAVMSHKIDNEFDTGVTADSATIMVTLYFDEAKKGHSNISFVMKKADGKWYIDLADTIKKERSINSGYAFQVREFKFTKQ